MDRHHLNLILFCCLISTSQINSDDVSELLKEYGYPSQIHSVTTSDGYILRIHRIPYSNYEKTNKTNKEVVFMMHGYLSSSADWVCLGRNISLAFKLADAGYDVWMGNSRGNTYSKKHISIKTQSDEFWNYSLDEIGKIDVPAKIDYILNFTKRSSLFYVGYSQGCTVLLIMLSSKIEYNSKIKTAVLLSPVAFLGHIPCPICNDFLLKSASLIFKDALNVNEILPNSDFKYIRNHCRPDDETFIIYKGCSGGMNLIVGKSDNMNKSSYEKIFKTFPAGVSAKQSNHFAQLISSGKFQSYDYGKNNIKKYGRITPPEYKLFNVKAPIAIFYGTSDNLLAVEDAEKVIRKLKNVIAKIKIEAWNHFDFIYTSGSYYDINSRALKIINNSSKYL